MKKLFLFFCFFISNTLFASRIVEAEYIQKISEYHEDGIMKSKIALSKTKNKVVIKIANKIINDQTKERQKLEKLRKKLYSDIKFNNVVKQKIEFKSSQNSSGKEFDKYYLDSIMENHRNEILITSKMLPEINNEEIHHVAIKLIKNNGNEIGKIEKIKNSL